MSVNKTLKEGRITFLVEVVTTFRHMQHRNYYKLAKISRKFEKINNGDAKCVFPDS